MERTQQTTLFVDVILPLSLPQAFTYRLPKEWNDVIAIGQRVIVQFGRGKKQYSAIVSKIHEKAPTAYQAKYIEAILDEFPILYQQQIDFWHWISDYYMANIGDVMNAALPGGLRLASESRILLHPNYHDAMPNLTDDEYLVVEALELRNVLDLNDISDILGIKYVQPRIKSLIEKKAVMTEEEVKQRFKPKMVDYVRLSAKGNEEKYLKAFFDELERAPRQLEMLMAFIQLNKRYTAKPQEVRKLELQRVVNASSSLVNELVKKEVFELYQKEAGRLELKKADSLRKKLNEFQLTAYEEVKKHFEEKQTVLLHGITSSGKTEIYIKLIEEQIQKGKQILYLLPEIALTTQIVQRLQAIFGEKVGVYHSRFNENERVEVWNNVMKFKHGVFEDFQIILGARSALFLPFHQLGLIIVDEEHESTFKQYDPSPRYQARDASLILAKMQNAKVLLGSATPSIESFYNASNGKYGLVTLNKRHGNVQPPEIFVADVKEATKKKKMKSHFSPELLKMMEDCLANQKQIILFQNRRGYSPFMICESCGNAPICVNCDVSLTYHKFQRQLTCHYCGYHTKIPSQCPACGDTALQIKGFGTEKIEEELAIFLPEAKTSRMDLDTTRAKKAYHQIITAFQEKEVDILVGTQMVTKGLDFDSVGLVGVLNADQMLQFPDFRAFERSYQLMSQVAGRAGRKKDRGKVLIQTYNPGHQIIRQVIDSDYMGMYNNELIERRNYHYPPFYRLIEISLRHRDRAVVLAAANFLGARLKNVFGKRILGPEEPGIARIRNFYHQNILLKIEQKESHIKAKEILNKLLLSFKSQKDYKTVRIAIDVDPV